jgi:hypothetical protein
MTTDTATRRSQECPARRHPQRHLSQSLVQHNGMTVEELKQSLSTLHPEMTCPLCGRPSTHLVM